MYAFLRSKGDQNIMVSADVATYHHETYNVSRRLGATKYHISHSPAQVIGPGGSVYDARYFDAASLGELNRLNLKVVAAQAERQAWLRASFLGWEPITAANAGKVCAGRTKAQAEKQLAGHDGRPQ